MAQQVQDLAAIAKKYGGTVSTAEQAQRGDQIAPPMQEQVQQPASSWHPPMALPESPRGSYIDQLGSKAEFIRGPRTWGEAIRENLPTAFGMVGGAAASLPAAVTGQAWLPPVVAGASAAVGRGLKDTIRHVQGVPPPPSGLASSMGIENPIAREAVNLGESAVLEGVLPELVGQGAGFIAKKGANVAMRPFAGKRNVKVVENITNPGGLNISKSGSEYGQPFQIDANTRYRQAQQPLQAEYDRVLKGPVGQATELVRKGGKFAKGSTVAQMHEERTSLLRTGRTPLEAAGNLPRRGVSEAKHEAGKVLQRMETAAKRHGLTLDDYKNVSAAWRAVEDRFANRAARHVREGMAGEDVIKHLATPATWRTFKTSGGRTPMGKTELLGVFKDLVDPQTWSQTQVAVTKKIVFDSSNKGGDRIYGTTLSKRLGQLEEALGPQTKELIPAVDQLKQVAKILEKTYGTPDVPDLLNRKATLLQWALKQLNMQEPDLKRALAQANNEVDMIEIIAEMLTRGGIIVGAAASRNYGEGIPEPPQGGTGRITVTGLE